MCACWVIPRAGDAIPGAVRVSGQAAVCTSTSIHVALVESDLGHSRSRPNIELLLQTSRKREATSRNGQNSHWVLTLTFSHSYVIISVNWNKWKLLDKCKVKIILNAAKLLYAHSNIIERELNPKFWCAKYPFRIIIPLEHHLGNILLNFISISKFSSGLILWIHDCYIYLVQFLNAANLLSCNE